MNSAHRYPGCDIATLDVSVIIVSYNTCALTLDCLRSIHAQPRDLDFEVFVVDNASADGSAAAIAAEFSQVRLIANTDNRGFAAANNQALRLARGRYVLLLNPDTLVLENCIANTVRYADQHADVAVVGCRVLEAPGRVQYTCFAFPRPFHLLLTAIGLHHLFPRSHFWSAEELRGWQRDTEREVDVVSGMFMLVRRTAIDEVGLLDEDYFVYAEEADWCYRFWKHGWRCVFAPVGEIIHRDGGNKSTDQVSVRMFVQFRKSLLLFHRKHLGWLAWATAKVIIICGLLPRFLIWRLGGWFGRPTAARKSQGAAAALKYLLLGIAPTS
jgi:GT2 family glycosyltransferase